jgi:hypothetical protein
MKSTPRIDTAGDENMACSRPFISKFPVKAAPSSAMQAAHRKPMHERFGRGALAAAASAILAAISAWSVMMGEASVSVDGVGGAASAAFLFFPISTATRAMSKRQKRKQKMKNACDPVGLGFLKTENRVGAGGVVRCP